MPRERTGGFAAVAPALLLCAGCAFLLNSQTGPYIPGYPLLSALLLRLAAPFFLTAAGFFWGVQLYEASDGAEQRELTRRACRRLAGKLLLFEPVVIAMRCCTALLDGWDRASFLRRTLLEIVFCPRGPYWVLYALLLDLLLLLPLVRRGREEWALLPAVLFYTLAACALRYQAALLSSPLSGVLRAYWAVFLSFQNALFFGLYFVLAGLLLAKHRQRLAGSARGWLAAAILALGLLLLETFTAPHGAAKDRDMMPLSFALLIPALFAVTAFCTLYTPRRPGLLSRLAASLYLLHLPLIWGWTGVLRRLSLITEPRANAFTGAALSLVSFAVGCRFLYRKKWQPFYDWIT